ncbi:MAG: DUF167 domain-containing protein [Desulfobacterales bacterium]|jgi:hypothetical protein|nr:DUF167 domain-containing protein [Desulfobacterales bacterium]
MLCIHQRPSGLSFNVRIQPRSSRNMVAGLHGDALKIKLTAAPVAGAANKMCLRFLAERLGVSHSALEILAGHTGRAKTILVKCDPARVQAVRDRIRALLEE